MGPPGRLRELPADHIRFVYAGELQGRTVGFRENTFRRENTDELEGLVEDRMDLPFILPHHSLGFFVFRVVGKTFEKAVPPCYGDEPHGFDNRDLPAPFLEESTFRTVNGLVEVRYGALTLICRTDVFMADRPDNIFFAGTDHLHRGRIGIKD